MELTWLSIVAGSGIRHKRGLLACQPLRHE
jgi:hypothetical protein